MRWSSLIGWHATSAILSFLSFFSMKKVFFSLLEFLFFFSQLSVSLYYSSAVVSCSVVQSGGGLGFPRIGLVCVSLFDLDSDRGGVASAPPPSSLLTPPTSFIFTFSSSSSSSSRSSFQFSRSFTTTPYMAPRVHSPVCRQHLFQVLV